MTRDLIGRSLRRSDDDSKSNGPGTNPSVPAASENNHDRAHFFGEPPSVSPGGTGAAQPRGLSDYLRVVRRRKWYIIGTAILVAGLAVVFSLREQKAYQAQSQVWLNRQDLAGAVTGTPNLSL